MFSPNPLFECPSDDTIIWKYIDFWKLESLIKEKSFYLPRADSLVKMDIHDGPIRPAYEEYITKKIFSNEFHYYIKKELKLLSLDGIEISENRCWDLIQIRKRFLMVYNYFLNNSFVTYWNIDTGESKYMWETYIHEPSGVAIVSTVGKLKECLQISNFPITISKVEYTDWENGSIDFRILFNGGGAYPIVLQMLYNKTVRWIRDKELRLVYADLPVEQIYGFLLGSRFDLTRKSNEHFKIPVDITNLIDEMYLCPGSNGDSKNKVMELISSHIDKFDCDKILFSEI